MDKKIETFYMAARRVGIKAKVIRREILLYAYPEFACLFDFYENLKYAHKNGFISSEPINLLITAIVKNFPVSFDYWLENTADVSARDSEAIRTAGFYNRPEYVKSLYEKGADIYACNDELFEIALKKGGDLLSLMCEIDKPVLLNVMALRGLFDNVGDLLDLCPEKKSSIIENVMLGNHLTAFDTLISRYNLADLYKCALNLRSSIFCSALYKAGLDINEGTSQAFWLAVYNDQQPFAEFLIVNGFEPKPQNFKISNVDVGKIYDVLTFCCKHKLHLKLIGQSAGKINMLLFLCKDELLEYLLDCIY